MQSRARCSVRSCTAFPKTTLNLFITSSRFDAALMAGTNAPATDAPTPSPTPAPGTSADDAGAADATDDNKGMFKLTTAPEDAPDEAQYVELDFERGDCVAVAGVARRFDLGGFGGGSGSPRRPR